MKRLELRKIERICEITHLINGSARIKKTERKTELIPGFLQESRSLYLKDKCVFRSTFN